jgi:hypothetical protein
VTAKSTCINQHQSICSMAITDQSAAGQRFRLLQALRAGPVSTIEARHRLDILMPAARVHELRHRDGHNIFTHWVHEKTAAGLLHKVAKYVLLAGCPT